MKRKSSRCNFSWRLALLLGWVAWAAQGQPLSWTVEPGQAVELAVLTGEPALGPFRFQWRRLQPFDAAGEPLADAVPLADATNRTYGIHATATNLLEQGETRFSPPPEGASAARFYRAILR